MTSKASTGLGNPDLISQTHSGLAPKLLSLSKSIRQLLGIYLARIDIVVGQDQLLMVLNSETLLSIGEVSRALCIQSSTTSKMADRLEEKGLVVRSGSKKDNRSTNLGLTEKGLGVRDQVRAVWKELEELLKPLASPEVLDQLEAIHTDLRKRVNRLR